MIQHLMMIIRKDEMIQSPFDTNDKKRNKRRNVCQKLNENETDTRTFDTIHHNNNDKKEQGVYHMRQD